MKPVCIDQRLVKKKLFPRAGSNLKRMKDSSDQVARIIIAFCVLTQVVAF